MYKIFQALILLFLYFPLWGQTITVVSDDNKGLPKARIDVFVTKNKSSFSTDLEGKWDIPKEFQGAIFTLKISYIELKTAVLENVRILNDTTIILFPSVNELEEIAVTAQYKTKLVEKAVHNIKVIDAQQIEEMAAQNVKEALNNELNIHLSEDNILGSNLQLQGIGGENVKILIDGVPITGRQNGNIDLSQLPIDNVERIEVVEGPLSVSYGTDALAGTINIITKKSQKNKWEGSSQNYVESSGKINNNLSLGGKFGKHTVRMQGGRKFFDGWNPDHKILDFSTPVADSSRVMLWKPKTQWLGNVNYQYRREQSIFNYNGQFLSEDIINRGMPRAPYYETAFDDYYSTKRINQSVDYQYRFENQHRISFTAGYSGYFREKTTKLRDLTTIEDILTSNSADHDTSQYHSFMARGRYIQAEDDKKLNYEVGFDVLHEIATGNKIENHIKDIGDYAIYSTAEYSPIEALTIRPGIRYSYNTRYKSPLTPSLNIKWNFLEKEKQDLTFRASYARGFRAPSIKELYYTFVDANHDIVGNKDLIAETSDNFNLSIHQNLVLKKVNFRNKVTVFYNTIYNQISLSQKSVTEYSYFNLHRFTTTGFQAESKLNYQDITIGAGIGYIGRNHQINEESDLEEQGYLFSPNVNATLQYHWQKTGLKIALFYRYSGELPQVFVDENGEYLLTLLKDYQLADFKVSKSFWNNNLVVSAGVKNIFNVINVEGGDGGALSAHSSGAGITTIGMGRTYHLGITINFNSK